MTEGPELLAGILANPDDDNVRLVYADWLQDHNAIFRDVLATSAKRWSLPAYLVV
jgi:uncharacterized protein (TIGR02996 family)